MPSSAADEDQLGGAAVLSPRATRDGHQHCEQVGVAPEVQRQARAPRAERQRDRQVLGRPVQVIAALPATLRAPEVCVTCTRATWTSPRADDLEPLLGANAKPSWTSAESTLVGP